MKTNFKAFLFESTGTAHEMDFGTACNLAIANCSDAIKFVKRHKVSPLKRSTLTKYNQVLLQGENGTRKSRNISNHNTIILDEALKRQGKDWPMRSASFICGNAINRHAEGYGSTLLYLLPYNGVKIGLCQGDDIFNHGIASPLFGLTYWPDVADTMDTLRIQAKNYQSIISGLKEHEKLAFEFDAPLSEGDIDSILMYAFNPKNLGMHLVTTASEVSYFIDSPSREAWSVEKMIGFNFTHKENQTSPWEKFLNWVLNYE